jgi:hypothetical protein
MPKNQPSETAHVFSAKTGRDLWDSIYQGCNAERLLHHFGPGCTNLFRFLGPFLNARRIYIPPEIKKRMGRQVLTSLFQRDEEALLKVIGEFGLEKYVTLKQNRYGYVPVGVEPSIGNIVAIHHALATRGDKSTEASVARFLHGLYYDKGWQNCILVNALLINGENNFQLVVLPMHSMISQSIMTSVANLAHKGKRGGDLNKVKVCGIFAHNIKIGRSGTGFKTKYTANVERKPSYLTDNQVEYICGNGLIDMRSFLKDINAKGNHFYHYVFESDYRMADHLMTDIKTEASRKIDEEEIEALEAEYDRLPVEAVQDPNRINNPISQLEVDFDV